MFTRYSLSFNLSTYELSHSDGDEVYNIYIYFVLGGNSNPKEMKKFYWLFETYFIFPLARENLMEM